MFDNGLTMKQQVDIICQSTYFETRRIGSIRQFLTSEATKPLVLSLVLLRFDYCHSPLAGILQKLVNNQHVKNYAVHFSASIQSKFTLVASRTQNRIQ